MRSCCAGASIGVNAQNPAFEALAALRRMQDQLIVFVALAAGRSQFLCSEPSLHTRTAIAVAEQLSAARFSLSRRREGAWLVECDGAGVTAGE